MLLEFGSVQILALTAKPQTRRRFEINCKMNLKQKQSARTGKIQIVPSLSTFCHT